MKPRLDGTQRKVYFGAYRMYVHMNMEGSEWNKGPKFRSESYVCTYIPSHLSSNLAINSYRQQALMHLLTTQQEWKDFEFVSILQVSHTLIEVHFL